MSKKQILPFIIDDKIKSWYENANYDDIAMVVTLGYRIRDLIEHFNAEDKLHDILDEKITPFKDKISELEEDRDSKQEQIESLIKQIQLQQAQVSSIKGGISESYIQDLLAKQYIVVDTTKTGRSGDIIIRERHEGLSDGENGIGPKIMIELKNYKTTVSRDEVTKFYRDIDAKGGLSGAIFLSLHSKIVGKEMFEYSMYNGIPIMFLSTNMETLILAIIRIMFNQINHKVSIYRMGDMLEERLNSISDQLDNFSTARSLLMEMNNTLQRHTNRIHETILTAEIRVREQLLLIDKELEKTTVQLINDDNDDNGDNGDNGDNKPKSKVKSKVKSNDDILTFNKIKLFALDSVGSEKETIEKIINYIWKLNSTGWGLGKGVITCCNERILIRFYKTRTDFIFHRKMLGNQFELLDHPKIRIMSGQCSLSLEADTLQFAQKLSGMILDYVDK